MLIERATNPLAQVQLIAYSGIVNPEHVNQINCIPMVNTDENDSTETNQLENVFIDDFMRKSIDFQHNENTNLLPIEIRLGTVYAYQNSAQQLQYPNSLTNRRISAQTLRNEERRPRREKDFFITFNKNKGIHDIDLFENELVCAGFRSNNEPQTTYRLYLRHHQKRLIFELTRNTDDPRYFSVKRLLKYSSKYTHVDVVRSKDNSNYSNTYDDIFDVRTSIGKADEEELHINDDYCNFIRIKNLNQCVFERKTNSGEIIYQFNRNLLRYFDFFQIKQTIIYDYTCIDSRFFGVRVLIEHQIGYDSCINSRAQTPCIQTNNVIMAKLVTSEFTEDEAKRIWTIGIWLSDLARRCTHLDLPMDKIFCRQISETPIYRHTVR